MTESDAIISQETIRPALRTQKPPSKKRAAISPVGLAVVVLIASAGWWAAARIELSHGIARQDEHSLSSASKLLGDRLRVAGARLEGECALIAQDPRIRFALSSAHDEATLADLLTDIKGPLGVDLIVLLNADHRVLASVGRTSWTGLDLGSSRVISRSSKDGKATSDVWGLDDRLLAVSASPVLVDGQTVAILVVGSSLGDKTFQSIYELSGAGGALLIQDRVVVGAPKELAEAFSSAQTIASGSDATIAFNGQWLHARAEEIADKALPARVLWLRPIERERGDYSGLIALLWIPMVGATLLGCAAAYKNATKKRTL